VKYYFTPDKQVSGLTGQAGQAKTAEQKIFSVNFVSDYQARARDIYFSQSRGARRDLN